MKNLTIAIKRFLSNKNTVTVLGVILGVIVLYFGYNMRINQAINPISVPTACETIQPRRQITDANICYVQVPPAMLSSNVIRDASRIVDYYSNHNTIIPAGSLFYTETVVGLESLPDAAFVNMPSEYVPFNMSVTMNMTYGNSIFPGNYIDVYFKAIDDNGQVMVGKMVENIKVLAVKDNEGNPVFQNSEELGSPSMVIFGAPADVYLLLIKSYYLQDSDYEAEIFPVPTGEGYKEQPGELDVTSSYLRDFINAKTANVPQDELINDYEENLNNNNSNNNNNNENNNPETPEVE